ncbi:MAG: pirin family protein [Alphaproteobacteria bacterium]|nr:pirin family protein [Alphaproteobacteria bacterium]
MIELVIDQRARDLGGGFTVGRVLPFAKRRTVGPFVFFDQMGPITLAPGFPRTFDVRPHPHIGLATVTYLFAGALTHRDSTGVHQEIRPGEVNWMVAGRGITHSERLERARRHGATMHGIQAWVALPTEHEETAPAFYHHEGADLPAWNEHGVVGRLLAGEIAGRRAAVKTHSAGACRAIAAAYSERAVFVVQGVVEVGAQALRAGQMAVLTPGQIAPVAAAEPATVMVLGGEPVGERFVFWNFVSSSKARLEQAKDDWRHGRFKLPPGDDQEFTPLPEDGPKGTAGA